MSRPYTDRRRRRLVGLWRPPAKRVWDSNPIAGSNPPPPPCRRPWVFSRGPLAWAERRLDLGGGTRQRFDGSRLRRDSPPVRLRAVLLGSGLSELPNNVALKCFCHPAQCLAPSGEDWVAACAAIRPLSVEGGVVGGLG